MTKEEIEKAKENVTGTLQKISAIDAKIVEFQEQLKKLQDMKRRGILFCAQNLKPLDQETRDELLAETPEALSDDIQRNMLSFSDLAKLDKRELQKLLFKCALDDLAVSVVLLDNSEVKKHIYSNVSKNNLQQIREKEKLLGDPQTVSKTDIAQAQRRILDLALSMEKNGEILFPEGI
ncbi:MAG: hypothetical protein MJ182_07165 [Treponema sp.]|nr:hypothetical protein [Treponema sp.]